LGTRFGCKKESMKLTTLLSSCVMTFCILSFPIRKQSTQALCKPVWERSIITSAEGGYVFTSVCLSVCLSVGRITEQESCAIAKMTAQCALHMGAMKIFGTPWLRPRPLFPIFSWAFVPVDPMNVPTKFEVRSFTRCWDNRGTPKIWTVPAYAHAPFSENFLMGFYSDRPGKYTRQIWSP